MFNNGLYVRLIQFPSNSMDNDKVNEVILIVLLKLRCNNFPMII